MMLLLEILFFGKLVIKKRLVMKVLPVPPGVFRKNNPSHCCLWLHCTFEIGVSFLCSLLSKTFGAHINVEYYNSIKSIIYVFNYINKGSNHSVFGQENQNEVQKFQMTRYFFSNEVAFQFMTEVLQFSTCQFACKMDKEFTSQKKMQENWLKLLKIQH